MITQKEECRWCPLTSQRLQLDGPDGSGPVRQTDKPADRSLGTWLEQDGLHESGKRKSALINYRLFKPEVLKQNLAGKKKKKILDLFANSKPNILNKQFSIMDDDYWLLKSS